MIREIFINADRTGPILLLLNNDTTAEADRRLTELPFLAQDLLTFDHVERVDLNAVEGR